MIRLEAIHKTYNKDQVWKQHVLADLSIDLQDNMITVVVGNNGSGKSTLLNIISGAVKQDSGHVTLDHRIIDSIPEHKRSPQIVTVFQNPQMGTAGELTILENLRLATVSGQWRQLKWGISKSFKAEMVEQLSLLGMNLENKSDQLVQNLSGGQRQALALFMAVLQKPKVLLLDEPTAALDPKAAEQVLRLAHNFAKEYQLCTLMVTHKMKEVLDYADRVLLIHEGKIAKDINRQELSTLTVDDLYRWFKYR
jgi:putative ABC transport system ATP-binding protein